MSLTFFEQLFKVPLPQGNLKKYPNFFNLGHREPKRCISYIIIFLSRFGKDQSGDGLPPRIQMLSCLARHRTRQLLLKLPLIYNIVNTAFGCPVVCATSLNSKYFPQQKSTKELFFLCLQYSYKVFQHRSAALSRFEGFGEKEAREKRTRF